MVPAEHETSREVGGVAPQRVRVTSSRRGASPYQGRRRAVDLHEQTGLGEVYLEQLMRTHLRLSLAVLVGTAVVIGLLILVFSQVPTIHGVHIGPVPLPWLMIGSALYPLAVTVGYVYVRHTERIDADFAETLSEP